MQRIILVAQVISANVVFWNHWSLQWEQDYDLLIKKLNDIV